MTKQFVRFLLPFEKITANYQPDAFHELRRAQRYRIPIRKDRWKSASELDLRLQIRFWWLEFCSFQSEFGSRLVFQIHSKFRRQLFWIRKYRQFFAVAYKRSGKIQHEEGIEEPVSIYHSQYHLITFHRNFHYKSCEN